MRRRQENRAGRTDSELAPATAEQRLGVVMGGILRARTIGGQLSRILAFALILVLILLVATVDRAFADYRAGDDTRRAVSLALSVQDLTDQLQRELGLSNGLLGGDGGLQQSLRGQRHTVDTTLDAVKSAADSDVPGADRVRTALDQLNLLANTRTQVDTRRVSRPVVLKFYNDAVGALNQLTLGLELASDADLQRGLQAFYALGAAKEQFDKERGFLNGVFVAGRFSGGEYGQFMEIRSAKQSALQSFSRYSGKARQADLDDAMRGDNAVQADQAESIALASGDGPLVRPVDAANWWTRMTGVIDAQRAVQQAVGKDIQARADELRGVALTKLISFLVGAAIAIIAMIALVFASVRALVRPLAALAGEADDVASRRLPQVIESWSHASETPPDAPAAVRTPAGASAEIAAVADALDRVQTTAFELASQQALVRRNTTESMGNLARRNQNLVRRQLALISEFERKELDPQGLANLFELDHLATRMRRNAESLLVLVGENSPRRLARPIGLIDVIRAGMSEVDDYRRVLLRRVEDVLIVGTAASELSHMLAELIENGLAYSSPDLEVEVYGRRSSRGYLLAVVDQGVGMSTEQLAASNAKLRGEQDFIVASTRYLGHYVVGRLAQRLGITVELDASPVSGIVARLILPAELLATEQDQHPVMVQALIPATPVEPTWGADTEARGITSAGSASPAPAGSASLAPAEPASFASAEFASLASAEPASFASMGSASLASAASSVASEPGRAVAAPPAHAPVTDVRPAQRAPEPGSIPEPGSGALGPTTANGLLRRNKRARAAASAAGPQSRPDSGPTARPDSGSTARPEPGPVTDRNAEETRNMLAAFRAGHERGATIGAQPPRHSGAHDKYTRADDSATAASSAPTAEENW
ncbi:nitrate- and nitrite sensing domain-containing protein [Nocardia sp. NPDC051030]|uniref:sensor histidine kinase n=1 Tax=Nocardia sp. NPDC051030 TaxID=3155162 RepID=UPI003435F2C3